ncbi:F-box domain-containing protein [Forsythia ovata]|uniref:F-box domain-containing protein n=1 Tax=Forsythia ovata TaxID=205694 RepID=A0ABD1PL26_9LAMI
MGPCHGLFCIYDNNEEFFLWNPATREIKDIPKSPIPFQENKELKITESGFGFDPKTRDYKLIKLVRNRRYYADPFSDYQVEVYTLSTNSWRKIDVVVPTLFSIGVRYLNQSTYMNGMYYWWGESEGEEKEQRVIVCFDMSIEKFEMIPLPPKAFPPFEKFCAHHCFTESNGSLRERVDMKFGFHSDFLTEKSKQMAMLAQCKDLEEFAHLALQAVASAETISNPSKASSSSSSKSVTEDLAQDNDDDCFGIDDFVDDL